MSLIHDALREIESDRPATATSSRSAARVQTADQTNLSATTSTALEWFKGIGAFVQVLTIGGGTWMWWQSNTHSQPAASFASTSPGATPALPTTATAPAPGQSIVAASDVAAAASSVPSKDAASKPEPFAASDPAKDAAPLLPPTAIGTSLKQPSATPATNTSAKKQTRRTARTATAPSPEPAEPSVPPVEQQFAELTVAMKSQDWEEVQRLLNVLRQRLPGQNIALLRAQAWVDLQQGKTAQAMEGYRALLQRLPGDEEAAINLASLLLQSNEVEVARQTLLQAVHLRPDSARLRAALRQFNPEVRP